MQEIGNNKISESASWQQSLRQSTWTVRGLELHPHSPPKKKQNTTMSVIF